jgi:hypothetical protein
MGAPAFVNGGDDLEVKLKDCLDGATVLFDAAGNVVDGRLAGEGHGPHLARGARLFRTVIAYGSDNTFCIHF